jgi:hypothetical protein
VKVLAISAMVLLVCCTASAQSKGMADLDGRIQDQSGAIVAGATIEISSFNSRHSAVSDTNGHFTFQGLLPGTYSITVTKKDFKPARRIGLRVAAGKPLSVKMSLHAGRSETFATCDPASAIDVTSTSVQRDIGTGCTNYSFDSIPHGRSVTDLF